MKIGIYVIISDKHSVYFTVIREGEMRFTPYNIGIYNKSSRNCEDLSCPKNNDIIIIMTIETAVSKGTLNN